MDSKAEQWPPRFHNQILMILAVWALVWLIIVGYAWMSTISARDLEFFMTYFFLSIPGAMPLLVYEAFHKIRRTFNPK